MNIVIILKKTFDTEEKIIIQNGKIQENDVKYIVNPYDEYAIEEALKLREEFGGEVTAISVGSDLTENALRTALAMGVDKAVLINDEALFGDEFTTSKVLAAVIKKYEFDIILAGNMSIDNGTGQIGPRLAEELGIPHVTSVTNLQINGTTATVTKDAEGDQEVIEITLPMLLTAQQGLNEPRYPSLPGIMKAKKKPIERLNAQLLGLNPDEVKAKSIIIDQFVPPQKESGKILSGELKQQVTELVELLWKVEKVI